MEDKKDNEDCVFESRHITIIIDYKTEFRISVDKFGNLEVIKVYGADDSSIHITPSVSNSIKIN